MCGILSILQKDMASLEQEQKKATERKKRYGLNEERF